MEKVCLNCGKRFKKNYYYSKKYWNGQRYCSIKCSGTLLIKGHIPWNKGKHGPIGSDSLSYKGGRNISKSGYIRVLIPGTGSYQLEHRKVMESYLKRKLNRTEQVHHINGIKTDNHIENLKLMDIIEHCRLETTRRWRNKLTPFRRNLL